MATQNDWVEALQIDPEKLSEWSSEASEDVPLLVWCLQNGKIPWESYAQWASSHFQMPVVNPAFFHEAFSPEMLEDARTQEGWSNWCFPVEKWEDVTVVACAAPLPDAETQIGFVYVLADPHVLKDIWDGPLAEAPAGISVQPNKTFKLELGDVVGDPPIPEAPPPVAPVAVTRPVVASKPVVAQSVATPPAAPQPPPGAPLPADAFKGFDLALNMVKDHYKSALIMRLNRSSLELTQIDPEWPPLEAPLAVDLTYPSLFRIAATTGMPYHGYVVDTPIHQQFFKALKTDEFPGCVTAVGIRHADHLVGVFIAWGEKAAQSPECLHLVESAVSKLVDAMTEDGSSAPAA